MLVSEIARLAGVTSETVRHYTRVGLLTASQNPDNHYKEYTVEALQRLRFIKRARALGFSVAEIHSIVDLAEQGESPCPAVRELMTHKIPQVEQQIAELQELLSQMKSALTQWRHQPDGIPTGHSVCCLIEDWSKGAADE